MNHSAGPIHVAIYLDSNYAIPATVLVRSLLDHLHRLSRVRLFVLGVGLSATTKRTMAASWESPQLELDWVDLDIRQYASVFVPVGYLTTAAYARLLIDRSLPAEVERLITLDCDGLILSDLTELWRYPQGEFCVHAVRDSFITYADEGSRFGPASKNNEYFNSGLLLINLAQWRREKISEQCIELAARHPAGTLYADNSLLNAILQNRWGRLPLRWNCNTRHLNIHRYPTLRNVVHPSAEIEEAIQNPGFLHFLSRKKPWHLDAGFHPDREIYLSYLSRTAWGEETDRLRSGVDSNWQRTLLPWRYFRQAGRASRKWEKPRRFFADLQYLIQATFEQAYAR